MPAYTLERKAFLRGTVTADDEAQARAIFEAMVNDAAIALPSVEYAPSRYEAWGTLEISTDDDAADLMEIDGREPD
jgi:hypothetical protein